MADYKVNGDDLEDIADAIRAKGGTSALLEFPDDFISAINALPSPTPSVDIVPFATGTDEQIAAMIDAAQAGTIDLQQDGGWAIEDVRTIHIDAFTGGGNVSHAAQDVDIAISSFDEYMSCGNVMQFDFKDALETKQRMNSTDSTVGGYGQSEMKTITLPTLVNALPTWLKNRLIEFSVLTSVGGGSSVIETITGNKLALRSEIEIFGEINQSVSGEGSRVSYYNNSNNIIKKIGHNGEAGFWNERSPHKNIIRYYCCVARTGVAGSGVANNPVGLAPFGCL